MAQGRHGDGDARPTRRPEDAWWFQATSWQGGEESIVQHLDQVSPGTYRITEPIPVDGTWKTTLRLHEGRRIAGLPIFMPEDPGIFGGGGPGAADNDPRVRPRQGEPPA